ncbi:MAG: PAS domain-containing protein [Alphaproteobacteria bacterium]|nr:PAS domain-containing protein [Alphaproteobacteria bacterium]
MRFRDALAPRLAVQTFDCWLALRVEGKVPRKDVLCPLGLPPPTLPYIMLMEHVGADEFRCRLIGTQVREWYGTNVVGQTMQEMIPPRAWEQRLPLLRHCIDEGAPTWFTGPMLLKGEAMRRGGRLMLPVSSRGERTDGIVLVGFFDEAAPLPTDASIAIDVAIKCPRAELG